MGRLRMPEGATSKLCCHHACCGCRTVQLNGSASSAHTGCGHAERLHLLSIKKGGGCALRLQAKCGTLPSCSTSS